ncbi:MAG: ATP-grasp domain-containing protein [Desulfobulbaceae bacterium]|nr:ATP-grasp domain-containing protein [Desulfobulbaceae bacterium]
MKKILVVGTTPDYIEWIRLACPQKALFLTDYPARHKAAEEAPGPGEEILTCLDDEEQVKSDLHRHLQRWHITLQGITCFDCESMELAATLAQDFSLPYPSVESIRLCRDKYLSKKLWQQNSVRCPRVKLVQSPEAVYGFMEKTGPCVIKPLSGSGSELVFRCLSRKDCEKWTQVMQRELKERQSHRLYSGTTTWFLAEEFISGNEYSCDFMVTDHGVRIIRLTRKIHGPGRPFGTIAGYVLEPYPCTDFSAELLEQALHSGAGALGINHAICMVDFLVSGDEIVLLEMTLRPGGDCIPHLLRRSGRVDMISLAVGFAGQQSVSLPDEPLNGRYVGLRLHARKAGQIMKFSTDRLREDSRIREIQLIRPEGHRVALPPADYDSWYLGYVIFQPAEGVALEQQCNEISRELVLETV